MAAKSPGFPKADPAATQFFRDLVPTAANVTVRPMFGHHAAFVDGTMFMGIFGDRVLVRLNEADRRQLLREDGASPFEPIADRPMKEYILLPPDWIDDPALAEPWVARAMAYAAALPKKPPKKAAKKKV
jgi:TfoX/Sxy family transcriptional regulator of competence genes